MGPLQSLLACTNKGLLIYLCIKQEGAVAFTKLQRFWILYFCPFQTLAFPRSCVLSPHCAIFRFHANSLSIFRTC